MSSSDFNGLIIDVIVSADELPVVDKSAKSERSCPECDRKFSLLKIKGTEVDFCSYCKSYWFDSGELAAITDQGTDIPDTTLRSREAKHPCPVCGEIMKEHIYLRGNNLLVDRCPEHGVYLESGELQRALDALKE